MQYLLPIDIVSSFVVACLFVYYRRIIKELSHHD